MSENTPRVVIVGAGFGGLRAVRALRDAPVRVTLVDRRNYHLFQPLLYQVATAGLGPTDIAQSVRAVLRGQKNLEFRLAEMTGADFKGRRIQTTTGDVAYDYLILAPGSETNYFGSATLERYAFGLKDLGDAVGIRNHVLKMFELGVQEPDPETRRALLTFVVVGGGPTGVECAGALSELIRLVLIKDYPTLNIKDVRVILLEASDKVLAMFPEPLREAASRTLWRKFIEVRFGASVSDFDSRRVVLKSGEIIPAHTLIWAAGVRAVWMMDTLGVEQGRLGRVKVTPALQLPTYPEVAVIGDAAHLEDRNGQPFPLVAPVAIQQAECVAQNIKRAIRGEPPCEFKYRDPGQMATIGRHAAVVQLGKLRFRGYLAWMLWLVVHIMFLIGFRNRLLVMINWMWDYFFYDRAVRLITREGERTGM